MLLPAKETSPGNDVAPVPKKHAACDECRTRKLKCSGEQTGCRRCVKQGLSCHYSIQKQMGRPPKRRRIEDDSVNKSDPAPIDIITEIEKDWPSDNFSTDPVHLIPQVYLGDIATSHGDSHTPATLKPISATADPWPDFATTSASASMLSIGPGFSSPLSPNITNLEGDTPQCPCLSYLYLCLSTISSLNSFSISRETITSLCTAARTAQSVIRCEICPLRFATGVQNVMMLGTLLSVMADAWYKMSLADAGTLGRDLSSPEFQEYIIKNDQDTRETWQIWLRQVLRRAVIGVPIHATLCQPTVACNKTPDILSLIREMEDRQRKWHSVNCLQPPVSSDAAFSSTRTQSCSSSSSSCRSISPDFTSKSTSRASSDEVEKQQDIVERDFLCLKIVGSAKQVVQKFSFHPWEYPEGVVPV